ncbi:MAG TPA: histone family protein [archaeon]|nr:histone family protein [archaeon]HLD80575.1 histone family protein [archaeon]
MDLPIAALDRLLRRGGAERVSEEAAKALGEVLEEQAKGIGAKASELAKHAKRKTVTAEDVRLAAKG